MEIKDILLFLETAEPNEARLAVATGLAARFHARLSAVCACPEPALDIAEGYAIGPVAVGEVLAHRRAQMTLDFAPVRKAFDIAAAAAGVEAIWADEALVESPEPFAETARLFDLAIVRRPHPHDLAERRLAELVAISSGAPCLLVPEPCSSPAAFDRVVVAWNGSREARRALDDSLCLLKRAKAVRIVTLGSDREWRAKGEDVQRRLERHGVASEVVKVEEAHGDDGASLLKACEQFDADLLVMGAFGRSPAKELILGGATRAVMSHAALPVFMAH